MATVLGPAIGPRRPACERIAEHGASSAYIPVSAFTFDGFRAWVRSEGFPDRGRFSFLGDVVYVEMSPERYGTHNVIRTELSYVLYGLVRGGTRGYVYGDGMLLTHEPAMVSNEPDLMFASFDTIATGRVVFERSDDGQVVGLVGTPDVVVEIVSPSSVAKDTRQLRTAYHAAGIPEYWLIDARDADTLVFDLMYWTAQGYQPVAMPDDWRSSPVFGHDFRLERTLDPLGDWAYTLHARPLSGS